MNGLKPGVLLELGFDDVTPNSKKNIGSWLYDYAADKVSIIDNRAKAVACYDPGYTFVEKLQTVSTKFRQQQASQEFPINFMRHYYDVYSLLRRPEVQAFIGTPDYQAHKAKQFRAGDNPDIAQNQPSSWPILRPAKPTPRRLRKAPRFITAISRRSIKSSKRSALGSTGCEDLKVRPHSGGERAFVGSDHVGIDRGGA